MRIGFVASEAVPFVKTGGLADVAGSMPKALAALGHDVRVFLPKYYQIPQAYREKMEHVWSGEINVAWRRKFIGIDRLEEDGVTVIALMDAGSKNNIQRKEGEEENGALKVRFTKIIRDVVEGEMEVPSAIEGVQKNANVNVAKRQFFNASGVELSQPVRGINIVRETLSDGTVRSHKVVIK
jgi:hypothetical protein